MEVNQTKLACCLNSYFYEKGEKIVLGDTQAMDDPS